MMLGSIFGLTEGTIKYVEWILYWAGNVSLIVSIVVSIWSISKYRDIDIFLYKEKRNKMDCYMDIHNKYFYGQVFYIELLSSIMIFIL